jgi:ribA/ribD-fused uncharacterized protein
MEKEEQNEIFFYDTFEGKSKPEHVWLNNFAPSPFTSKSGLTFATVEHYYQCHKFGNFEKEGFKEIFEEIRTATSADLCKKISRKYSKSISEDIWNRKNWDEKLKEYYMKRALTYKFSQHKDLLKKLLETGNAILKEESLKDKYWGGLLEGSGNRLGAMLMELRTNYNESKSVYLEGSEIDPIKVELN